MEQVRREESSDAHSLDDKQAPSYDSGKVEAVQYDKVSTLQDRHSTSTDAVTS